MKSKRSSRAVERILCATDPASVPSNLSAEEKIRWLEAQNKLLRFHYTALMEHRSGSSPEDLAKKKEVAAVQSLTADGYTIKEACRIAGIPRCAYYRALKPSAKAESDAELVRLMCDIENDRHVSSSYGLERLTGEVNNRLLKAEPEIASKILRNGTRVNHKRVHRLMKEHDIHSRIRRRKHPDNYYKAVREMLKKNRAPNILKRNFTAERPMAKLTTDVTYIPCSDQKFIYLSPLFDLFNHEIKSYSISTANSEEFVKRMLAELPPEALKDVARYTGRMAGCGCARSSRSSAACHAGEIAGTMR